MTNNLLIRIMSIVVKNLKQTMKNLATFSRVQRRVNNRFVKSRSIEPVATKTPTIAYCFIDRYNTDAELAKPLRPIDFEQVVANARNLTKVDHIIYLATNHDTRLNFLNAQTLPDNLTVVNVADMLDSVQLNDECKDKLLKLFEAHLFFGRHCQLERIVKLIALANNHHFARNDYDVREDLERMLMLSAGMTQTCVNERFCSGISLHLLEMTINFLYREHTEPHMFDPIAAYRCVLELPPSAPPLRLIAAIRRRAKPFLTITCNEFVSYTRMLEDKLIERGVCPVRNDYTKYIETLFDRAESILMRDT